MDGEVWCEVEREEEADVATEPRWNVVLLDDDDHTYQYVIQMLATIFGYSRQKGYEMACEVDATGRVVVWTGGREEAVQKRDAILAFGPDGRMPWCGGSMTAIVEPVA